MIQAGHITLRLIDLNAGGNRNLRGKRKKCWKTPLSKMSASGCDSTVVAYKHHYLEE